MQATTDKPTLTWENVRHWADASSEHRPGGSEVAEWKLSPTQAAS